MVAAQVGQHIHQIGRREDHHGISVNAQKVSHPFVVFVGWVFRRDFVIGGDNDILAAAAAGITGEANTETVLVADPTTTEDVKGIVRIRIIVVVLDALVVKDITTASSFVVAATMVLFL